MIGECRFLPVPDVLCPVSIVKRAQSFFLTLHCRRNGGNDTCFGAATKGVAQQPGQLAVSVRNVSRLLHKCCDDTAKGQQALIDESSLLCTHIYSS